MIKDIHDKCKIVLNDIYDKPDDVRIWERTRIKIYSMYYSQTCIIQQSVVLTNLAGLGNIRFGGHQCKLILVWMQQVITRLLLQYFPGSPEIYYTSLIMILVFHFQFLFGKQLLQNGIHTIELLFQSNRCNW